MIYRRKPAPERKRQTPWKTFLQSHWDVSGAIDFTTIEVWTRGLDPRGLDFKNASGDNGVADTQGGAASPATADSTQIVLGVGPRR